MSLTIRLGVTSQPTMEKPVDDLEMGATRNNVIISVLDGSLLEVYSRKHVSEETGVCMQVYVVFAIALTVFFMWSIIA